MKLQALRTATLLKRDSCEICEKFKSPYFTEHLQWLLLAVSGLQSATLLKRKFRQRCFSVNFAKLLRTSSDKTPPDDCFLILSMNFENYFRSPLLYNLWESAYSTNVLKCWSTSCRILTSRYSEKLFHRYLASILSKE